MNNQEIVKKTMEIKTNRSFWEVRGWGGNKTFHQSQKKEAIKSNYNQYLMQPKSHFWM